LQLFLDDARIKNFTSCFKGIIDDVKICQNWKMVFLVCQHFH